MYSINIPNEVLENLKEELKAELLKENKFHPPIIVRQDGNAWDQIKQTIVDRCQHLNTYDTYTVINSFSGILRHTFGISQVKYIPREKHETAIRLANSILDEMDEARSIESELKIAE